MHTCATHMHAHTPHTCTHTHAAAQCCYSYFTALFAYMKPAPFSWPHPLSLFTPHQTLFVGCHRVALFKPCRCSPIACRKCQSMASLCCPLPLGPLDLICWPDLYPNARAHLRLSCLTAASSIHAPPPCSPTDRGTWPLPGEAGSHFAGTSTFHFNGRGSARDERWERAVPTEAGGGGRQLHLGCGCRGACPWLTVPAELCSLFLWKAVLLIIS